MKQKKEVDRKLNTMHNIKMAPSWLLPHANAKAFSILTFCVAIDSFVNIYT